MESRGNIVPKVSILVLIYNVGDYIAQCARSIFEQTLENIEIIFLDDAATDDSVRIIEKTLEGYPNRMPQVRILHHSENKGTAISRKDCLDAAQGEFILFIDGDDYIEPKMAESMYHRAMETDADIVSCNFYKNYPKSQIVKDLAPHGEGVDGETLRDDAMNRRIPIFLWCRLIRRSLFLENEILWPVSSMAEDMVITTQASYFAHKLAHVAEPFYHYRINPHSYAHSEEEEKRLQRIESYKKNNEVVIEFIRRNGLEDSHENLLFMNKVIIRNMYVRLFQQSKYQRIYLRTFPEVSWAYLFGNKKHKPTWRERVWIIAVALGLYPLLRKKLLKYCSPSKHWRW